MIVRFLLIFISFVSFASATIVIQNNTKKIDNFVIEYYYDDTKKLDIDKIQNINFKEKIQSQFTFGYINGNNWFKIDIHNKSQYDKVILYMTEPYFEEVNFYQYIKNRWEKQSRGLLIDSKKQDIKDIYPQFIIDIKPNTIKTIYIQIYAPVAQFGEFQIYTDEHDIVQQRLFSTALYMFYLGCLFIIIVFNSFLFLSLKSRIYLYYINYVSFYAIFVFAFSGLNLYFGFAPWHYKFYFAIPISMIFLILFSNSYLNTKKHLPTAYKMLQILLWIFVLLTIITVIQFYPYSKFITIFASIVYASLILVSIKIWMMGEVEAKYYVFAMTTYTTTMLLLSAMANGWIQNNDINRYAFLFGSFIEIVFFSLMLSNRFYKMQSERIKIQDELINIKHNNEQFLQNEVEKRTNEITKINKELKVLVKDKELLLKEVYHRVKNNFQIVVSMLSLELNKDKNKAYQNSFSELINRIKSMSIVHQFLYDSKTLAQIKSDEYLLKIIEEAQKIYDEKTINITNKIDSCILSMDEAMILGIIANEILNNSIKHHPLNRDCNIFLEFKYNNNKRTLIIKDNGDGFNQNDKSKGLGLQLVKQFSKKLKNSKISFDTKDRVIFELNYSIVTSS